MPSDVGSGLLEGGVAADSRELPTWQDNAWVNSEKMRTGRLWFLRWPLRWSSWFGTGGDSTDGVMAAEGASGRKLRPTAYLDGLRGFAALLVYIHHNVLWAHASSPIHDDEMLESSFGYKGNFYFATMPFVRNFFTGGHSAVAVFYVISGYVLAAKPLSLILAGDHIRLLDSLASSVFRRWFRLYIPIMATTLFYVTTWHLFGYWVPNCDQQGSLVDEWWNWYVEVKNLSFLFKEGPIWVSFNVHLWSIPLEMRGSIIVFCTVLALFRASHMARHLCMIALMVYFLYIVDGYYGTLFVTGVLLCDLDLLAQRNDPGFPRILRRLEPYKTRLSYFFLTVGMFLAGVPSYKDDLETLRSNPGWYYLSFLKPQAVYNPKWFYLFFASLFIVASIPRIPLLRRFFESPFCQYLGRISYSLYLVHGPVLSSIGDRVYYIVGWVRPNEQHNKMLAPYINRFELPKIGPVGLELSFLAAHLVIAPVTFLTANFVTRWVDEPAVRLPAKLYKFVLSIGQAPARPEDTMRLA